MKAENIPCIPDGVEINEAVLKDQEAEFLKILEQIMSKAKEYDVQIRVIGSLAFRIKCPDFKYMEYENDRYLTDVDFIAYSKEIVKVQDLFFDLGWSENQNVLRLFGDRRRIFYHPELPIHSDIFINKLHFCHKVDFRKRLGIDYPTISLIDLLLEKLQIVEINKKDLVDTMVLLCQYPVSLDGTDKDQIDADYLAKICSKDWGWWKTATVNLDKVTEYADEYLKEKDIEILKKRVDRLNGAIENKRKSLRWKLRSIIGDKVRWYREVEEVER